jgi:demethylmenaquinone methyltransferase / 2-methoxy-6-polyprenyl-1,4-benzoquinol methylase
MANYSHDRIVPFKDSELGKKQQIAEMFDKIAFRYDFLNRFLSGGIDIYWRRRAIRELRADAGVAEAGAGVAEAGAVEAAAGAVEAAAGAAHAGADVAEARKAIGDKVVLDVATGTGDMAIMMAKHLPGSQITGVDISSGMLDIGRQKVARLQLEKKITLQQGDSETLPFPDRHFDAITVAFGVRNFEHLEKGIREMGRVLKPGGKLIVLEFSQPRTPVIRQVYDLYLRLVAPNIGRMISSSREAYQYLNDSVRAFPEGQNFIRILDDCGYIHTRLRRLSFGICSLYIGEKAGNGENPSNGDKSAAREKPGDRN